MTSMSANGIEYAPQAITAIYLEIAHTFFRWRREVRKQLTLLLYLEVFEILTLLYIDHQIPIAFSICISITALYRLMILGGKAPAPIALLAYT